jgi:hypothetical protein
VTPTGSFSVVGVDPTVMSPGGIWWRDPLGTSGGGCSQITVQGRAATYSVMGGLLWHFLAADGLALQGGGRGAHRDHSGRVRDSCLWVAILRGIQSDRESALYADKGLP